MAKDCVRFDLPTALRSLFSAAAVLAAALLGGTTVAQSSDLKSRRFAEHHLGVKIVRVKDANNLLGVDLQNVTHLIRLWGIDAPEMTQPGGREAWLRVRGLVLNKHVLVRHRFLDERGRLLGRVYHEGTDVSRVLVEEGLAWYYDPDTLNEDLKPLEAVAKRDRIGIWKRLNPVPPWHWRVGARSYREGMEGRLPRLRPRYPSSNKPQLLSR